MVVLVLVAWVASSAFAAEPQWITFSRDIAPILYAQCAACHREGETAPFALVTYDDARKHAKQIADVTSRRIMPPWKAEHGFGDFLAERRLSDVQIDAIGKWQKAGAPRGDTTPPEPPKFSEGWQLGEPDLIVKMAEPYTLTAEGRDVYRCFVIPVKVPEGKYLRAVEFRPGNRKIVHHAVLTTLPMAAGRLRLSLTGDGKSFSSGLVAPGERLPGSLGIWTPGYESRPLPQGCALAWPANCDLVVQLHLHPSGKVETEQSSVGLYFTSEKPTNRVRSLVALFKKIDIAPGDNQYAADTTTTVRFPCDAYGLFPHMHLLGRTVRVTATLPNGAMIPMLAVWDWDFNWQNYYQYAKPIHLPVGTKVQAHWTFDNSAENPANPSSPPKRVTFGEQTTDEMAALLLDVIPTK
jgi:hypothetical protein